MILHGLKNCDTCRKALKALESAGQSVTFHDVRADGVSKAQISKWAKAVGWETLLNTRSTTWRELNDAAKTNVNEKTAIALMIDHPTLIKRPVIEAKNGVFVGWNKQTQTELL